MPPVVSSNGRAAPPAIRGVRTDALNWDLLNDGVGNPKQTKSLLFSLQTPPAMISGIRPNGETAIRTGMRYIMFVTHKEADALDIEAFLRDMPPVPSPALVDGKLSPAAVRGSEVFIQAACAEVPLRSEPNRWPAAQPPQWHWQGNG